MFAEDIAWFFAFATCLPNIIWSLLTIISYLKHKPPGHQSVYDIVAIDVLHVTLVTGCVFCIVPMISLTESFQVHSKEIEWLVMFLTIVFEFSFACNVISIGCGSIVRILCIIDISLVEDNVGEARVGPWLKLVSIIVASFYTGIEIATGDFCSGAPYNFMIKENVPAGKPDTFSLLNQTIYDLLITLIEFQVL